MQVKIENQTWITDKRIESLAYFLLEMFIIFDGLSDSSKISKAIFPSQFPLNLGRGALPIYVITVCADYIHVFLCQQNVGRVYIYIKNIPMALIRNCIHRLR